ncbi:MAG: hypothetical protein ACRDWS_13085 [Acidimicrobiia bacterium]
MSLLVGGLLVALIGGVAAGIGLAGGSSLGDLAGPAPTETPTSTIAGTQGTSTPSGPATTGAGGTPVGSTAAPAAGGECAEFPAGEPFIEGAGVQMVDLGESGGVRVEGAVYPRPDYPGDPWSQWGQGWALADGRFYSGLGDHQGPDGNSYLYEYDLAVGTLTMIGDLLSYVDDHTPGTWGYGKIHAQMVGGACGEIYLSSYWGSYRGLNFTDTYRGDILFRLDPERRTIDRLTVPVDQHGQASMAGWAEGGLLYGEALDPLVKDRTDNEEGPLFVYDVRQEATIFQSPDSPHVGFRNILVDAEGRAYYSIGGGQLSVYDPGSNAISTHPHNMPADWLRASTAPAPDGRVAAVTDEPYTFFVLHPSGEIQTLGPAQGYTASLAMHPDGDRFFYVPHAHGGSAASGTPLVSVDLDTGEEQVVVQLNPLAEQHLGLTLGGSYDVVVSPAGDTVYVGMNSGPDGFGEVVLLVVHLP